GRAVVVIGEVNRQMPFMLGPAVIGADTFDLLLEHSRYEYDLFAPPNQPLSTADSAIGVYGGRLVRDGGTLQIGIGEIGDAVVYGLQLRQQQNAEFREILNGLKAQDRFGPVLDAAGGDSPFEAGFDGGAGEFAVGVLCL